MQSAAALNLIKLIAGDIVFKHQTHFFGNLAAALQTWCPPCVGSGTNVTSEPFVEITALTYALVVSFPRLAVELSKTLGITFNGYDLWIFMGFVFADFPNADAYREAMGRVAYWRSTN